MVAGLTRGRESVVTRAAIIHDTLVIKLSVRKGRGGMADRAVLTGRDVWRVDLRIFASSIDAVVTRCASFCDTGVVEQRGRERAAGHMTHGTVLRGNHMIGLRGLSGRVHSVMTGIAPVAHHLRSRVIDKGIPEITGAVADRAVTAGVLMDRCRGRTARAECSVGATAVMTGGAVA